MTYEKRIDRENPGCIVFLIDQSGSMQDPMGGATGSKATNVAGVVNSVLYELVLRCIKSQEEGPRHYYDIGVVGYGGEVRNALRPGSPSLLIGSDELGRNPAQIADVVAQDGSSSRRPIWIEPRGNGGTPMCGAFDLAGSTVAAWIQQHPGSFPPIVINITDGESTDGDPATWADRLRALSTSDGSLLLFNVNISEKAGSSIVFPADGVGLPDASAQMLFRISSVLPDYMVSIARASGYPTTAGARGFAFNADFSAVASFLRVGTSTAQMDR